MFPRESLEYMEVRGSGEEATLGSRLADADEPRMKVTSIICLGFAALLVVGALSNKKFYFGKMGGGAAGRQMPTWAARAIIILIAGMFIWAALTVER